MFYSTMVRLNAPKDDLNIRNGVIIFIKEIIFKSTTQDKSVYKSCNCDF